MKEAHKVGLCKNNAHVEISGREDLILLDQIW